MQNIKICWIYFTTNTKTFIVLVKRPFLRQNEDKFSLYTWSSGSFTFGDQVSFFTSKRREIGTLWSSSSFGDQVSFLCPIKFPFYVKTEITLWSSLSFGNQVSFLRQNGENSVLYDITSSGDSQGWCFRSKCWTLDRWK